MKKDVLKELNELAERCLGIVRGLDADLEDGAEEMLSVGEPDLAIADTLAIAHSHPELYARFPDDVYELAKDPRWRAIHAYLDLLEQHRG